MGFCVLNCMIVLCFVNMWFALRSNIGIMYSLNRTLLPKELGASKLSKSGLQLKQKMAIEITTAEINSHFSCRYFLWKINLTQETKDMLSFVKSLTSQFLPWPQGKELDFDRHSVALWSPLFGTPRSKRMTASLLGDS